MTARLDQRGTALVAALGVAIMLLPVGAFVMLQAHTDIAVERNLRHGLETFYAAEAGLEHAVAEIPPGVSFDALLVGPDQVAGTRDDGRFPFRTMPPPFFPQSPLRYEVDVMRVRADLLRVVSRGSGASDSATTLEALVARSPTAFTPAAVYLETDPRHVVVGDEFWLSGWDHRLEGDVPQRIESAGGVPALTSPDEAGVQMLRERLAVVGEHLAGIGTTPSISAASRLGLDGYVTRLAADPAAVRPTLAADGSGVIGTPEQPQLTVVDDDLRLSGRLTGAGVLVIRGGLHVTGTLEFAGLLVVAGAVVLDPVGTVTVTGALWRAAGLDDRMELRGRGAIRYGSEALAAFDRLQPGRLPHAATIVGWQEQL